MACIKSVGKVVALGDAIKSVSTRYSSNKVQDLKSVEDKIETSNQTLAPHLWQEVCPILKSIQLAGVVGWTRLIEQNSV